MSKVLDAKVIALKYKEKLLKKFGKIANISLAIIYDNTSNNVPYLKSRKKLAECLNVKILEYPINLETTENDIIKTIIALNNDTNCHGIMLDRPLDKRFDENKLLSYIDSRKDVDGFTNQNLGALIKNDNYLPCATAMSALTILDYYHYKLEGKNVLVIGRSVNVGKPLALLLLSRNATVTVAHSKSKKLDKIACKADIIFSCVGKANFITPSFVKKKTIIIDIGINYNNEGKIVGDVDPKCYSIVKAYSPVPGGVGVLTNYILMNNLYISYLNK